MQGNGAFIASVCPCAGKVQEEFGLLQQNIDMPRMAESPFSEAQGVTWLSTQEDHKYLHMPKVAILFHPNVRKRACSSMLHSGIGSGNIPTPLPGGFVGRSVIDAAMRGEVKGHGNGTSDIQCQQHCCSSPARVPAHGSTCSCASIFLFVIGAAGPWPLGLQFRINTCKTRLHNIQ